MLKGPGRNAVVGVDAGRLVTGWGQISCAGIKLSLENPVEWCDRTGVTKSSVTQEDSGNTQNQIQ